MIKAEIFDEELQYLANLAKTISHPARLAILQYLSETKSCISGDISDQLPLSRTTVSQHLKELRDIGLIHATVDGLKINYCLGGDTIQQFKNRFDQFFESLDASCELNLLDDINNSH